MRCDACRSQAIVEIAELLELHPAEVQDTLTFYGFFSDEQHALGKHRVWVCRSISLHAARRRRTARPSLCQQLGVQAGRDDAPTAA